MCNQNHDAFYVLNDWCCICGHILLSPSTTEMREKAILLRCSCSTIHKYFSSWIIKMKLYASIMQLLIPLEMPPHLNLMCIRMKWCVYFKSADFLFCLFFGWNMFKSHYFLTNIRREMFDAIIMCCAWHERDRTWWHRTCCRLDTVRRSWQLRHTIIARWQRM